MNALGAITTPVYDNFSRPNAVINARGFRTTTVYDGFGRAAARQDAAGNLYTTVFDAFGRVSGIMDPASFPTTATFDALDRRIAVQDALGHVNSTLFDAAGRVQATVNALGNISTTVYDSTGRSLAQVNELGCRTTFGYDQRGSRIGVTNARGFTWTASFDALGRNSANVDPLGRGTTLAFDARGLVSQQTDGKGQVETRTYDALGRQIGTVYATGKLVTTTFDLLGRKTAEANENGTWNRTYDAVGQRLTEMGPGYPSGLPLTSAYDAVGNRTQLQTWRGSQSWSFDGLNRSRTLVDIEGSTYTWSYEPRGYLNRLDYPNGVVFSVAYGSTGRPWQGSYSSAADSQVELVEYSAYDAVDNPTTMHQYFGGTHGNGRFMSYDAANQLTYWSDSDTEGPTAVFDPAGNPSSAKVGGFSYSYTYDAADELVNLTTIQPFDPAFTSATFSYDSNGNRIKEQFFQSYTSGPRTDLTTYTWDPANRLLQVQQTAVGAVDLTNSYRPDGLRHQRTDNSGTTQILWDGDEPLAQVDTLGNLQRYWSRAGAPATGSWMAHWSRLVKARLPGNPYPDQYLHADAQGTILAVSGSNGAALTHNQPPPRVWGMDGTLIAPFSWEGEHGYWYEGQLARPMHYVRARWFVDGGPGIGGAPGWLSPDPLGFGGGDWNLYRYVKNRPTTGVDPSGRMVITPVLLPAWLIGDDPSRCGKRQAYFDYTLASPDKVQLFMGVAGKCSGWIVQQVTWTENQFRCDDTPIPRPATRPSVYWEGWPVEQGASVWSGEFLREAPGPYTDRDFWAPDPPSKGSQSVTTVVKYFCGGIGTNYDPASNTIPDLTQYWPKNQWLPVSGTLPSTADPNLARFFDDEKKQTLEPAAGRSGLSRWCCCPPVQSSHSEVSWKP